MSGNIKDLEESNKQLQDFAKQLKTQSPDYRKDFETSKKVISSLNEQLSNQRKKIYEQQNKIKNLETEAKKVIFYENFSEQGIDALEYKKRYAELVSINKTRGTEIEDLKSELDKLRGGDSGLIPPKNIKKEKGVDDDSSFKDKESESKSLEKERVFKDTIEKKDRELAKFKAENAKFQLMMKRDLEKIKKMSLAYDPNLNQNQNQKLKEAKAVIEKLKQQNSQFRNQIKKNSAQSPSSKANHRISSDTSDEMPSDHDMLDSNIKSGDTKNSQESSNDNNNNNNNAGNMDKLLLMVNSDKKGDADGNEQTDTASSWNNIPLT
jgi:multidrug resistance efflux pump